MDTDELRALVTTLEKLITEASRVTGELRAAITSAEANAAPGPAVVASPAVTVSREPVVPVANRFGTGASAAVRAPASTPWARKRAATSAVVRPEPAATAAATARPAAPGEITTRPGMPAVDRPVPVPGPSPVVPSTAVPATVVPVPAAAEVAPPASPSSPVVAEPGPRHVPCAVDSSPGPVQAVDIVGPSRETRRPPSLSGTGGTPPAVSGVPAPPGRHDAPLDTRAAVVDSGAAAASAGARVLRERSESPEPAAPALPISAREAAAPHAQPVLSTGRAEVSAPPERTQLAGGRAEQPRMAVPSDTSRPPAPEPRPVPRTVELPPELSLQLARITGSAGARTARRPDEPVRGEVPARPVRAEPPVEPVCPGGPVEPVRREISAEAVGAEPPRTGLPPAESACAEEPRYEESSVEPAPAESPVMSVHSDPPAPGATPGPVHSGPPVGPVPSASLGGPEPAEPAGGPVRSESSAEAARGESPVEPVHTGLPAEPDAAPALHLVGNPSTPETLSPPEAEPAFSPPEALTVVPGTGGDPADAIRLAEEMARRHGLRIRGFGTAGMETEVVHQIAAALNDLLAKYTVALYGIEVTEQRDDTIRRERKKAAESGSAEPPPVWITLERAELTSSGAAGPGSTRRRFRRGGTSGRPAYTSVVRAFAAALDEAGDYRARQEAWRILMAGSLSGGPDIGAGLLDPGRALVEGFVEVELHGKRAGEPAKALHRALLTMAQADSAESTA